MGTSIFLKILWTAVGFTLVTAQEDSLRSALNAVDRRQKLLADYSNSLSPYESSSDYLPETSSYKDVNIGAKLGDDYYKGDSEINSPFRERIEENNKERQMEELAEKILAGLEDEELWNSNNEYKSNFQDSWNKYKNRPNFQNKHKTYSNLRSKKRNLYYPQFGLDGIGLRKKNNGHESDYFIDPYLANYAPNPDYGNIQHDSLKNKNYDWNRYENLQRNERSEHSYNSPHSWSYGKTFPVTKRSSDYKNNKEGKQKKEHEPKTDPKVEKDLSKIFGSSTLDKTKEQKLHKEIGALKHSKEESKSVPKKATKSNKEIKQSKNNTKTKMLNATVHHEKPLTVSKKSIDWSDYFGLDRRKKSEDLDSEWLLERYHKAISLKKKRNANYSKFSSLKKNSKFNDNSDELKIDQIDAKLKNMEDSIVDDALKYTGAHQGISDEKEIQDVKDRIISRLAAAYSLEKMRRALGEYKLNMAREKQRFNQQAKETENDFTFSEDKRVSVPRKEAIDPDRSDKNQEDDNRIKCVQGEIDCDEQKYRPSFETLEQANYETAGCPRVQKFCNDVAELLGPHGKTYEAACNIHQMCLLCDNNNSWFAPTRQCNMMFLSKVFELCGGDVDCQKEAKKSVKYLVDMNRMIRPESLGECDLICPDGVDYQ